jgi:hypothetical protein
VSVALYHVRKFIARSTLVTDPQWRIRLVGEPNAQLNKLCLKQRPPRTDLIGVLSFLPLNASLKTKSIRFKAGLTAAVARDGWHDFVSMFDCRKQFLRRVLFPEHAQSELLVFFPERDELSVK